VKGLEANVGIRDKRVFSAWTHSSKLYKNKSINRLIVSFDVENHESQEKCAKGVYNYPIEYAFFITLFIVAIELIM